MKRCDLRPGTVFQYDGFPSETLYVDYLAAGCLPHTRHIQRIVPSCLPANSCSWTDDVIVIWAPPVEVTLPPPTEKAHHQLSFPEKWCDPGLPATNTLPGRYIFRVKR